MCIVFFKSHHEGPREHYVGSLHCAHLDCAGTFEAHSKYLLEEPRADCADCLAADGDQVDQDVRSYAAIPHCELAYVEGTGWVKVGEKAGAEGAGQGEENVEAGGQDQEDEIDEEGSYHSFRSLSDVDSITSHWRLDPLRRTRQTVPPPQGTSPAPAPHAFAPAAEPYETRSAHDPHEIQEVGSPYHENDSNQDPNIPYVAEGQFGDSPNTQHRHLVNKQLKAHAKRISRHRRQNSRPGRLQQRHGRQNSRPAVDVVAPHPYTFAMGGNSVHQGLPGGHVPGYLAGQALTWVWGPVPPPHLRGMYPPVSNVVCRITILADMYSSRGDEIVEEI